MLVVPVRAALLLGGSLLVVAAVGLAMIGATLLDWRYVGGSQPGDTDGELVPADGPAVSEYPTEKPARDPPLGRAERVARLEEIFSGLPAATPWAQATRERISAEIAAWTAARKSPLEVVSLECRGEILCRLILDHGTEAAVAESSGALVSRQLFSWKGGMVSSSVGNHGGSDLVQMLFLLERGYRFTGSEVVKRTGRVSKGARGGER